MTCFSFYANKTITTGEGGMLVTDDERSSSAPRSCGCTASTGTSGTDSPPTASWEYDVVAPGFKYNLPDVAAAIGLAQLERAEKLRSERQRCARSTTITWRTSTGSICRVCRGAHEDHAWHLFSIVLNDEEPRRAEPLHRADERSRNRDVGALQAAAPDDLLPRAIRTAAGGLPERRAALAGRGVPAHLPVTDVGGDRVRLRDRSVHSSRELAGRPAGAGRGPLGSLVTLVTL